MALPGLNACRSRVNLGDRRGEAAARRLGRERTHVFVLARGPLARGFRLHRDGYLAGHAAVKSGRLATRLRSTTTGIRLRRWA